MAEVASCPNLDDLRRFALGRLPETDAVRLQRHLASCANCLDTLHNLEAKDTLVEAMRVQGKAAGRSEDGVVAGLVAHLDGLQAPAADTNADGVPATARGIKNEDCSFLAPPQAPDELGRLGGYRVLKVLGAGGMGIVLEAEDPRLKRRVALKVMKPALAASELARQRFHREAQSIAALEHDHIVAIHKVGEDRGVPYLAMPLLQGESLEERLRNQESGVRGQESEDGSQKSEGRGQKSEIAEAVRIGREIAEGLAAAHAAGITHRDIKPANVWLEKAQGRPSLGFARVKLLDFGLARPAEDDAHLTQVGTVAGTPSYMAPEQAEGKAVDPRSDLFSLGAVLYRMTTGRLPFPGANAIAVLQALAVVQPAPPRKLNPNVPAELSSLITRLLAKKPADRPQTAHDVVETLARIERDHAATLLVTGRPSKRRRVAIPVCLTVTVFVAIAAGLMALRWVPVEPSIADGTGPFVVLAGDGSTELRCATLQEALDEAIDDDVIEVRGDGPFSIPILNTRGKALTIRAGDGYWPVFQPEKADVPVMLYSIGALVLEGLEFRNVYRTPHARPYNWSLRAWKSPVRIANCRFVLTQPPITNAILSDAPLLEMRNCQVLSSGDASHLGNWTPQTGGTLILENNIFAGAKVARDRNWELGPGIHFRQLTMRRAALKLTHNTLVGRHPNIFLECKPGPEEGSKPRIHVDASFNVWDTTKGVFRVDQKSDDGKRSRLPVGEADGLLRGLVTWRDRMNVLPERADFLDVLGVDAPFQPVNTLDEWRQFWRQQDSGDFQGSLRYQEAELYARLKDQPESLMPEDFRLAPGSAGKGVGEGGRDLGADVDLVGPGPAYQRWKKTPGYQAWLATSEQRLEAQPFVVLEGNGRPEAKFVSLAAAVAAAKAGDVIEIRGRGPFVSPPIKIAGKPLTIRAGAGCRPIVQLRAEGLKGETPLLQSNARLTIEGLELRRASALPKGSSGDAGSKGLHPLVAVLKAPLFVAHCRFLMTGPSPATALVGQSSPLVEVRHCQFGGGPRSRGLRWASAEEGRLVVENCLFAAMDTAVTYVYTPKMRRLSLRFVGNTVAGGTPLWATITGQRGDVLALSAGGRKPIEDMPIELEITDNLLDADNCAAGSVNLVNDQTITPQDYRKLLHCLIGMREERNLFRAGLKLFDMHLNNTQPIHLADNLAEWQEWQPRPKSGSREEQIRYQTADPQAKARSRPERTHPSDFRRHLDMRGIEAGKALKRGIRPGQVGPGAYDRWRATPEYQEWLKVSSEVVAGPVTGPGPFVVLGDEANTYANLEAAVDAATDGDVIEIRGDGPFPTPQLLSFRKALTIRAGPGFTPALDFEPAEPRSVMLYSNRGALTLEGLTLRHVTEKPGNYLVSCQRAPCRLLNCRFERGAAFIEYSPHVEVRNCMYVTPSGGAFLVVKRWSGDVVVENNIAVAEPTWARGVVMEVTDVNLPGGTAGKTTVRLARNTFVLHPIDFILCAPLQPATGKDTPLPVIRLDVSDNVFDCDNSAMTFTQNQATYTTGATEYLGADAEGLLRQMFDWQGRRNLYPQGIDLFFFYGRGKPLATQPDCRDLAAWERIWGVKEIGSILDRPRYQGGDMRARPLVIPSPLLPHDLKLAPDSAGAGTGDGGRDRGADTKFVGPGPAYELYRTTSEYAAWRQANGLK